MIWILIIIRPAGWIGFDVMADAFHFPFITEDGFVMVALPDDLSLCVLQ